MSDYTPGYALLFGGVTFAGLAVEAFDRSLIGAVVLIITAGIYGYVAFDFIRSIAELHRLRREAEERDRL